MTADHYLRTILKREQVNVGPFSPVISVIGTLRPMFQRWGGAFLLKVEVSGSFAKRTCNKSGTDIDLFLSLKSTTPDSLSQVRATLRSQVVQSGYLVRDQNVSLGINVGQYKVDLVPAKRQSAFGNDHSLFRSKANTWTKTNVHKHINIVANSGRTDEIRIVKLWRDQNGLEFPSIYLELCVLDALHGCRTGNLDQNVWLCFGYLRDRLQSRRIVDPANTGNVLSDELSAIQKSLISSAAARALLAQNWNQIVV